VAAFILDDRVDDFVGEAGFVTFHASLLSGP